MPAFDNAQAAMGFVRDQTKRINTQVYEARYPDYDYAELVPVNSEGPEWGRGVITYVTDQVGEAKWVAGGAKDIPLANIVQGDNETTFHMSGIGYDYTLEEVNVAALIPGMNLTPRKADAARSASQRFLFNLALMGDVPKGMVGLFNDAGVTAGNVAGADANARLWVNKTPQQIVNDVNTLLTGIYTGTAEVEMADTLILPTAQMLYAGQQTLTDTNSETILSFIKRTNTYTLTTGQELMIRMNRRLDDAGAGDTARMVAYKREPRVLEFHLPMPHKFLPVWQNGPMNFMVPGIFRTGGLEIRHKSAVRYADGI